MKEEMKATQSEIKQNVQGTNSDRKETGTQSNNLEQKEEISIQLKQNEDTRMQKNEKRLRNLWDNLSSPTLETWGCQKDKRKSKKLKTYLNK